jgi:hypothetical protein
MKQKHSKLKENIITLKITVQEFNSSFLVKCGTNYTQLEKIRLIQVIKQIHLMEIYRTVDIMQSIFTDHNRIM